MLTSKPRILVIDDEILFLKFVKFVLFPLYACRIARTGEEGLQTLWSFNPHLLLLDLHLPGIDGLQMIRLIREDPRVGSLRILTLTADTGDEITKKAFEAGADDCLKKPCTHLELLQRIANCLCHDRNSFHRTLSRYGMVMDLATHSLSIRGKEVRLTPTEFALLQLLMREDGAPLSRESLIETLPEASQDQSTRSLDMHIARLRKKLGRSGKLIKTVQELGYCLKP
ncbi:MAG: hypothetical protein A3J74_08045 [Elusimicrobia bacterium RIFCSPHIGHO2_02_FULL_57_9]|nr:MAG: hypothetical protein A3J74_08045 [Elusimicrobia bacterium RIFCSPHIGHO2_02_FULL_57_9]